jgi:aminopeptidase YwaD
MAALPHCHPLVRTIATGASGLTAEVIDIGRGTPEEFEAHKAEINGRIVLVRHELMFAAGTIHRRRKYDMARANGAVGFLIAGPLAGHVVAGSSGRDAGEGIPALGVAPETAAKLARRAAGFPKVTITIETDEGPAETETLVYDYPGQTDEWVVLSAHGRRPRSRRKRDGPTAPASLRCWRSRARWPRMWPPSAAACA